MPSPSTRVSAAVWPWNEAPPPPAQHRLSLERLLAQAAFGLVLAALLYGAGRYWHDRAAGPFLRHASGVALIATSAMFTLGLAHPRTHARILGALLRFVHAIGVVLTAILLPFVYYTVFLAIGGIRRLGGSDPMGFRFPPPPGSLWHDRRAPASPSEYERQF